MLQALCELEARRELSGAARGVSSPCTAQLELRAAGEQWPLQCRRCRQASGVTACRIGQRDTPAPGRADILNGANSIDVKQDVCCSAFFPLLSRRQTRLCIELTWTGR